RLRDRRPLDRRRRLDDPRPLADVSYRTGAGHTEIASLETRLIRWMVGTVLATAALTFGILRFLAGSGG
ncbi:MAG: hypothetical protein OXC31_28095, partial [Spirochaetaceae bacterium]|nr:hypothetical protein [Spirochaetaceae bacterium]